MNQVNIRRPRQRRLGLAALVFLLALVAACVENPVTGERELGLVAPGQEVTIGEQQYAPMQQMSGGEYAVDPELTAYVSRVGQRVAAVSDRELPYEFVVLNSSVPNAWALSGGKIAINRGLLTELENEGELAAVLGHEVVHAAARHGAQAMQRGMLLQGALLATVIATHDSDYGSYAVGAAQLGAALVSQKYGRDAERESDRYGIEYMVRAGYDPAAAVTLQEKFVALSEGRRSDWLSGLFASHPPSQERVENNRELVQQLQADGEIGADRYAMATAELRRRQPAYEVADEGRKALAEGDIDAALEAADEALAIAPRESQFHLLKGYAHYRARRYDEALEAFDEAVELDSGYFANWQGRGMTLMAMGQRDAARTDLEQAQKLLPTAQSMNALGQIALAQGRREEAVRYLSAAAEGAGPAAEEAQASLVRLQLPSEPGRFVQVRWGLDDRNRIVLEVANAAPMAVTDVVVEVRARTAQGRIGSRTVPLSGRLAAGERSRVTTRVTLSPDQPRDAVDVRVVRARPAG